MPFYVQSPEGERLYDCSLGEQDSGKFQWSLRLDRVNGIDVRNRGWRVVGPEFASRTNGGAYLGWSEGGTVNHRTKVDVKGNYAALTQEYDSLFHDEIELSGGTKMGRPSAGRSVRLQPMVTPEIASWLEAQIQRPQEKSVSDVVFRLLRQAKENTHSPISPLDDVASVVQSTLRERN